MIKFEKVKKIYLGDFVALDNINLEIKEGEFVSVVGRSGAGKTTLAKLIYAEEMPTEGAVYFHDRKTSDIRKKLLPFFRRNFGTVFQDFKLLPKKTAFENIAYALEVAGESTDDINKEVPEILDIVGLVDKSEKYPHQLSGGEKQRVSLARALVHSPDVIVADEPTGNLDPASSLEIMELLLKINKFGSTVILATHDKDIVNKLKKRVITMEKGKIISDKENGKYTV